MRITGMIGFGIVAAAQVWFALLIVRSLMGLLSVPLHPGAARAVGNWFPPGHRPVENGLINGAAVFAYAVVHPIFGSLIDRFDWPVSFVITASVTALLALVWLALARDRPVASVAAPAIDLSMTDNNASPVEPNSGHGRNLLLLTLSYSAVGYFQYLFFYWLHYYFDSVLHMDKAESRYFAGLPNLAMAACMPIGGWLADRATRRRKTNSAITIVPKIGMLLSALFLVCGVFARDRLWIVACFTAALGTLGLCESSFWTVAVTIGTAARRHFGRHYEYRWQRNWLARADDHTMDWHSSRVAVGIGVGAIVGVLGALCWFGIRPCEEKLAAA